MRLDRPLIRLHFFYCNGHVNFLSEKNTYCKIVIFIKQEKKKKFNKKDYFTGLVIENGNQNLIFYYDGHSPTP
jgi:hypothetical protein